MDGEPEEPEETVSGHEPEAESSTEPFTMALGLAGASRAEADALARAQQRLVKLQTERLEAEDRYFHEEAELRLSHMRWRRLSDGMKGLLQIMTAAMGLAIAGALAWLVWDAAQSRGLVIEAFSVPPDLAQRGLSGQVVATQILDRLQELQTATDSQRAPQTYANDWSQDIKVEIPETGISIGELRRFLRAWLGADTRISGEVYHTASGLAVTAHAGNAVATFAGAESELEDLIRKAAEQIYAKTQPYRYANYLDNDHATEGHEKRVALAAGILRALTTSNDAHERAWAWYGLGAQQAKHPPDDNRAALVFLRKALVDYPDFSLGYASAASREFFLDREESAVADERAALRLLGRDKVPDISDSYLTASRAASAAQLAFLQGDYGTAVSQYLAGAELPNRPFAWTSIAYFQWWALIAMGRQHDAPRVRSYMREQGLDKIPFNQVSIVTYILAVHAGLENWPAVLGYGEMTPATLEHWRTQYPALTAIMAEAKAHTGDLAGAKALIADSPLDSIECLVARGRIADFAGDTAGAESWFARAVREAPSTPFGNHAWGRSLLAHAQADAAIEKFRQANAIGPHFADPLEGWGEALMAKNQSHLALAKFAEAEKYAPNWGRLHLKWGEALTYAGRRDEARAQFARAAQLELTPSEKAELAPHP